MAESILVYTFTALILYWLARNLSMRESYASNGIIQTQTKFWSPEIFFTIIIFATIAGARYNVGIDHLYYLSEYISLQTSGLTRRETYEPGFMLMFRSFAESGFHYFYFFALFAAMQLFFIYYALKDRKFLLPYIALSIMLGPYFLNWMNGMRQCLAMCMFVFLVEYIIERKFWKFTIGILIAATMHKSAIALFPLYFILFKEPKFFNRVINLAILFVCVAIGTTPTWTKIILNAQSLLSTLGYDFYAENIELLLDEGMRHISWGPSRIGLFLIDVLIIWYFPKMKVFYRKDKYISFYFILLLMGAFLYNLLVNTSHIFIRPIEYFTIFRLPLSAYLLYYLKSAGKKYMFATLCIIIFSYIYFIIAKSVLIPSPKSDCNLYKFFFQL